MRLISHPAVLAAIALLAANDNLLRGKWPSSLSGKPGDPCWLFFFPAVLVALMVELGPASAVRRRRRGTLLASMAAAEAVEVLYREDWLSPLLRLFALATVSIAEPRRIARYIASALPWAFGGLPRYWDVAAAGLALGAAVIFLGRRWVR